LVISIQYIEYDFIKDRIQVLPTTMQISGRRKISCKIQAWYRKRRENEHDRFQLKLNPLAYKPHRFVTLLSSSV